MNQFLTASQSHDTVTQNNAVSHSTSGSAVLDYFAKAGTYRNRPQNEVDGDMARIFGEDPELALKVVFYNRLVTRKCKGFVEETSMQKGQGQKDEFLKSLNWLERNRPELLENNLWLTAEVGCWKDLVNGYVEHGLSTSLSFPLLSEGISDSYHRALVAKFLPKIRSKSNTKNERHRKLNKFARNFASYMGWSEQDYRKFKSNPENSAHQFQRDMCEQDWENLNINSIPGRALFRMVSLKGRDKKNVFERHNLENKLIEYVKSHPVKFTGYPYELFVQARGKNIWGKNQRTLLQKYTYDAQFEELLRKAKEDLNPELLKGGVLCALDTSGSMSWNNVAPGITPLDVCLGLGIYFSSLIEGHFHNHIVKFASQSKIVKFTGESFCDKVDQVGLLGGWGSTNFQSVIDEIVRVRRSNPNIPVSDFPKILLVVSDMQFNPSDTGAYIPSRRTPQMSMETNHEAAMRKLREVGLPEMTVIWWDVNGNYGKDVPSKMNDKGTVLISGFDGTIVTSLLGGELDEKGELKKLTPMEQMMNCLDQEILNCVEVS